MYKKRQLEIDHKTRNGNYCGDFSNLIKFVRNCEADRIRSHQQFSSEEMQAAMAEFERKVAK